jgi:hypothetical protein
MAIAWPSICPAYECIQGELAPDDDGVGVGVGVELEGDEVEAAAVRRLRPSPLEP